MTMGSVNKEKIDEPRPVLSTANDDGRSEAEIEARMLELLHQFPKGISNQILEIEMPTVDKQIKVCILNKLLSKEKVSMFKAAGTQEWFWCLKSHPTSAIKGDDNEERVVLRLIEEAWNKGIWTNDIQKKSSLNRATLNKVLKALEGKSLIKSVSSVSVAKKNLYMLFNLQPAKAITGWYNENDEFESETVDLLYHQCYGMLLQQTEIAKQKQNEGPFAVRNSSFLSSKEICLVISDMKLVKFNLTVEDIETILDALVFEQKVEKSTTSDGNCDGPVKMYRTVEKPVPLASSVRNPCGVCPVMKKCGNVGGIQPKDCSYFNEWLNVE